VNKIIVLVILFIPLFCYSQDESKYLEKYMFKKETLRLNVPDSCAFRYILDIAMVSDRIFICTKSEYPIQVYNRNGKFIKTIGRMGYGPEEFLIEPQKIAVNLYGDKIALTDGPLGFTIYLIQNDTIKRKSSKEFKGAVDLEFVDDNILLSGSSVFGKHLKIINEQFEILEEDFKIPETSSILNIVKYPFWAVQKVDAKFITHLCYPAVILNHQFKLGKLYTDESIDPIKFSYYQELTPDMTLDQYLKSGTNGLDLYTKFSKLKWIISTNNRTLGQYISFGENGISSAYTVLFYNIGNRMVDEIIISNDIGYRMIPHNDQLFFYDFIYSTETLDVNLSIWQLKK